MILILILASLVARADCSKSIKRSDLDLIVKGTPPAYAVRHDCAGDGCVCVPDDVEANSSALSVYDLSKEGLVLNEYRKRVLDSEKALKESEKELKSQRLQSAKEAFLSAESDSAKVSAITELLKAKDDL